MVNRSAILLMLQKGIRTNLAAIQVKRNIWKAGSEIDALKWEKGASRILSSHIDTAIMNWKN